MADQDSRRTHQTSLIVPAAILTVAALVAYGWGDWSNRLEDHSGRQSKESSLSYYLANFAEYDATYGSLGAAIGLMMWMWMSTIVVLFGAELNSELEHQTARDSTDGGGKPLGFRGAEVADTVGDAR